MIRLDSGAQETESRDVVENWQLFSPLSPVWKTKAWPRFFEGQAFLGFPPPSSPPEKMVNITLGNNRTVKKFWCFLYTGVCRIPYT